MKYKQQQYQKFFWDFSKKRAKNFVPKILSTKVPMYECVTGKIKYNSTIDDFAFKNKFMKAYRRKWNWGEKLKKFIGSLKHV